MVNVGGYLEGDHIKVTFKTYGNAHKGECEETIEGRFVGVVKAPWNGAVSRHGLLTVKRNGVLVGISMPNVIKTERLKPYAR